MGNLLLQFGNSRGVVDHGVQIHHENRGAFEIRTSVAIRSRSDPRFAVKLYVHVGTEKTASSFLQKLAAKNRQWLSRRGVCFPGAGWDESRLLRGSISPGNAKELGELICRSQWGAVLRWIRVRVEAAENQRCGILLLSSELLISALSRKEAVSEFLIAADGAGVGSIHALLVIRDPIDQALSLYKHRAKAGIGGDVDQWIQTGYSLHRDIDEFLDQVSVSGLNLTTRKYESDGIALTRKFFNEWLGIDSPPQPVEGRVNPSLTLSELQLIRHLANQQPLDVPLFYESLLSLPLDLKAEDGPLEDEARITIGNYLSKFGVTWCRLNDMLAQDGGIALPEPIRAASPHSTAYSLSDAQIGVIVEAHRKATRVGWQIAALWRQRIRPFLGRTKSVFRRTLRPHIDG